MNQQILDASWYQTAVHVLECAVGLMIGTELVWNKLKRSGRTIIITTLTQSVGTFLLVSLVFGIVFLHFGHSGLPRFHFRRNCACDGSGPRAFHRPGI